MWVGFGQTVSKQYGAYDRDLYSPIMPLSTASCPQAWLNYTQPATVEQQDFPHLAVYDISYIWFSAMACMWTLLVGSILSLPSPADHRTMDKRLISPALPGLFSWAPRKWRQRIRKYYQEIGSHLNENQNEEDGGQHNHNYLPE